MATWTSSTTEAKREPWLASGPSLRRERAGSPAVPVEAAGGGPERGLGIRRPDGAAAAGGSPGGAPAWDGRTWPIPTFARPAATAPPGDGPAAPALDTDAVARLAEYAPPTADPQTTAPRATVPPPPRPEDAEGAPPPRAESRPGDEAAGGKAAASAAAAGAKPPPGGGRWRDEDFARISRATTGQRATAAPSRRRRRPAPGTPGVARRGGRLPLLATALLLAALSGGAVAYRDRLPGLSAGSALPIAASDDATPARAPAGATADLAGRPAGPPLPRADVAAAPTTEAPADAAAPPAERPGDSVTRAQAMLASLGYYSGRIDGVVGPKTRRAVSGFRNDAGLPDGRIDGTLLHRLHAALSRQGGAARERPNG